MTTEKLKELRAYFDIVINAYDSANNITELIEIVELNFPNEKLHRQIYEEINKEVLDYEIMQKYLLALNFEYSKIGSQFI